MVGSVRAGILDMESPVTMTACFCGGRLRGRPDGFILVKPPAPGKCVPAGLFFANKWAGALSTIRSNFFQMV
ncbi:hypothetical protein GCM10007860_15920 [Chitiniphilus shinanonensis]|uniref:Uncharacterized protein n=2 Tax=Chitiniphilus shinanonensis TaxID=553088 RepID=A0ABQ6BTC1_9NEIS|nr:hypothetical protein GCM10007860_15920 [Chitiniphilus shinanonensis]